MPNRIRVFYDGGCPLCLKEISHYRRIQREDVIDWLDITDRSLILADYGLTFQAASQRFHVLDQQGRWETGAHGFVILWKHLPYYRYLAAVVESLRLVKLMDLVYSRWAVWRLRRRCSNGQCMPPDRTG